MWWWRHTCPCTLWCHWCCFWWPLSAWSRCDDSLLLARCHKVVTCDGASPRDSRHTLPGPGPRKRGCTKLHCLTLLQYFIFQVFIATWTIVFLSVDIFLMMKTCFCRYLFWLISICVLCSKQSASKITNMWIMWSFQMPPLSTKTSHKSFILWGGENDIIWLLFHKWEVVV